MFEMKVPPLPSTWGTYLLVIKMCPICEGSGQVLSSAWAGYRQWLKQRGKQDLSDNQKLFFQKYLGLTVIPAPREECPRCEGTGSIAEWHKQPVTEEKEVKGDDRQ